MLQDLRDKYGIQDTNSTTSLIGPKNNSVPSIPHVQWKIDSSSSSKFFRVTQGHLWANFAACTYNHHSPGGLDMQGWEGGQSRGMTGEKKGKKRLWKERLRKDECIVVKEGRGNGARNLQN